MSQQMDLKAITSANVVYKKIDEEEKRFFEEISNKKIEPKNAMDFESIERIEPFMSKYIKNLNSLFCLYVLGGKFYHAVIINYTICRLYKNRSFEKFTPGNNLTVF